MGKAVLLFLFAASLLGGYTFLQTNETRLATTDDQAYYQEQILAQQIAESAYNVAYRRVREGGSDLNLALANVNGRDAAGRPDVHGRMTGRYQGGRYEAYAVLDDGHTIGITAIGYYGRARHVINAPSRLRVLAVRTPSVLNVRFLESSAGYCSAIWLEQYVPVDQWQPGDPTDDDGDGYFLRPPTMIFPAGHNRDMEARTFADTLSAGTQMNFFIAVDMNCSEKGTEMTTFDERRFDHIHHALESRTGALTDMKESTWMMVEQNPTDDQKWRIAWEDIHNLGWANSESDDPRHSLHALKHYGYDGTGWPTRNEWGYRTLRDYGDRPDLSDQVIEATLTPITPSL